MIVSLGDHRPVLRGVCFWEEDPAYSVDLTAETLSISVFVP